MESQSECLFGVSRVDCRLVTLIDEGNTSSRQNMELRAKRIVDGHQEQASIQLFPASSRMECAEGHPRNREKKQRGKEKEEKEDAELGRWFHG